MDDLVEQVVMKVGGCRKTQKLHSERGDEAQRDSSRTQGDEHWQVVRVVLESHTVKKKKTHHEKTSDVSTFQGKSPSLLPTSASLGAFVGSVAFPP